MENCKNCENCKAMLIHCPKYMLESQSKACQEQRKKIIEEKECFIKNDYVY